MAKTERQALESMRKNVRQMDRFGNYRFNSLRKNKELEIQKRRQKGFASIGLLLFLCCVVMNIAFTSSKAGNMDVVYPITKICFMCPVKRIDIPEGSKNVEPFPVHPAGFIHSQGSSVAINYRKNGAFKDARLHGDWIRSVPILSRTECGVPLAEIESLIQRVFIDGVIGSEDCLICGRNSSISGPYDKNPLSIGHNEKRSVFPIISGIDKTRSNISPQLSFLRGSIVVPHQSSYYSVNSDETKGRYFYEILWILEIAFCFIAAFFACAIALANLGFTGLIFLFGSLAPIYFSFWLIGHPYFPFYAY